MRQRNRSPGRRQQAVLHSTEAVESGTDGGGRRDVAFPASGGDRRRSKPPGAGSGASNRPSFLPQLQESTVAPPSNRDVARPTTRPCQGCRSTLPLRRPRRPNRTRAESGVAIRPYFLHQFQTSMGRRVRPDPRRRSDHVAARTSMRAGPVSAISSANVDSPVAGMKGRKGGSTTSPRTPDSPTGGADERWGGFSRRRRNVRCAPDGVDVWTVGTDLSDEDGGPSEGGGDPSAQKSLRAAWTLGRLASTPQRMTVGPPAAWTLPQGISSAEILCCGGSHPTSRLLEGRDPRSRISHHCATPAGGSDEIAQDDGGWPRAGRRDEFRRTPRHDDPGG